MVFLLLSTCLGFLPGERLEYDVRYGPVNLGTLELRALAPETIAGVECRHMQAELELTSALTWLFWARYEFESWATPDSMITLRSRKRTRETNYRADWTADFDRQAGLVRYSDGAKLPVPPGSRDLLTLWFWFRECPLEPGRKMATSAHVDRRNYRVEAIPTRHPDVRTRAGTFDCIVVTPTTTGPLGTVFLADRPDRIPVVIRTQVAGLTVSAMLRRVVRGKE
uniref:DUF3108 domain-containing protein n=1 Tax=candidate division WOR-3 bacterium TaxID=2052148 RepID=A0A7C4GH71_UNCW3